MSILEFLDRLEADPFAPELLALFGINGNDEMEDDS